MKYIIDIPDDRIGDFVGSTHLLMPYSMAGHEGHHDTGLELTPYTNIDIKEKAEEFSRGYDEGWDAGSKFHEAEKESIEDEVWEFVRTITDMTEAQRIQCFGSVTCNLDDYLTYQQAKSKYEAWKKWKKQKDEIRVGDEVIPIDVNYDTMIVTRIWMDDHSRDCLDTLGLDGSICSFLTSNVKKTGRHFDEVAELLKKMRGEEE